MNTAAPITAIRNQRRRPSFRTARFVALLGLLLAACASARLGTVVPPGAQPGDLALEACTYKIHGTEFDADCGTLVVPENRAVPEARLISLAWRSQPQLRALRTDGNCPG